MDKQSLMNKIRQASLCAFETALFLDTHPDNPEALKYYHQQREVADSLTEEYTSMYGPLSMMGVNKAMDGWAWAKGPWPWEKEAN